MISEHAAKITFVTCPEINHAHIDGTPSVEVYEWTVADDLSRACEDTINIGHTVQAEGPGYRNHRIKH